MSQNTIDEKIGSVIYVLPGSQHSNCAGLWRTVIVIIGLLLFYQIILMFMSGTVKNDPLNIQLFTLPLAGSVGGWSLSHFVFFFIVGLLFPDCGILAMTMGVVWEIIEEVSGNLGEDMGLIDKRNNDEDALYKRWWSGRISDIIFNAIGFFLAKFIADNYIPGGKLVIPYINENV